jgi:hypothetical protein
MNPEASSSGKGKDPEDDVVRLDGARLSSKSSSTRFCEGSGRCEGSEARVARAIVVSGRRGSDFRFGLSEESISQARRLHAFATFPQDRELRVR